MSGNAKEILRAHLRVGKAIAGRTQSYLGELDLTYPQRIALMVLDGDGPMPISDLATAMGSANSTISGVVDRLERLGLAKRIRSEQDRRKIYVTVTEKFVVFRDEATAHATNDFDEALKGLSVQQREDIVRSLDLLAVALGK